MKNKNYDFLIIGCGIFGITAAIELANRNHKIGIINPGSIPHHLAASTDISKVVRMEYGSDQEYFQMAEICIERWHDWNEILGEKIYHEVGFLMLCQEELESEKQVFEKQSLEHLSVHGYVSEKWDGEEIQKNFPAINSKNYRTAIFNPKAGYVESGRVVEALVKHARKLGVNIHEGQTAQKFIVDENKTIGIKTQEGGTFHAGHLILSAGANTPYLLPELKPFFKTTGHPVFWLKPKNPKNFTPPYLSVFSADISNTGWYGFPFHEKHGVVKIGKHANGLLLHPNHDDRKVTDAEVDDLRVFLKNTFPELYNAPLVHTRRCLYTDTLDGHFWIDRHPHIDGLTVSSGGSGHGFKMAPLLGQLTADAAEGKKHAFSERYRWRLLTDRTVQQEEARFVKGRKV